MVHQTANMTHCKTCSAATETPKRRSSLFKWWRKRRRLRFIAKVPKSRDAQRKEEPHQVCGPTSCNQEVRTHFLMQDVGPQTWWWFSELVMVLRVGDGWWLFSDLMMWFFSDLLCSRRGDRRCRYAFFEGRRPTSHKPEFFVLVFLHGPPPATSASSSGARVSIAKAPKSKSTAWNVFT